LKILNLTQHNATPEQIEEGVFEPSNKKAVQDSLTFDELPTSDILRGRAKSLADYAYHICKANNAKSAMIGGAPFFMAQLEYALVDAGIRPLYAFSKRVSSEIQMPDGSVKKTVEFKHTGFVGTDFAEV
jgi:hypothetical protein